MSASALANNIVSDPGFESATGTTSGSETFYSSGTSLDGGTWNVTAGNIGIDTQELYVFDGNNSVILNGTGFYATDALTETLTTVVGQSYYITYWADSEVPNSLFVNFGSQMVSGIPAGVAQNGFPSGSYLGNSPEFVKYVGEATATSTSTALTFTTSAYPNLLNPNATNVELDDVSVSVAPEPGTIVFSLTGLAGLAFLVVRRRKGQSSAPSMLVGI
jgi:hypothetical protein